METGCRTAAVTVSVTHVYRSRVTWRGSTAAGYEVYERRHSALMPPAEAVLALSADPAFCGDERLANPEQLLLLAASSCQLLSFLAVAARARIDVVAYEDDAEAVMPEGETPLRITRIALRPRIRVTAGTDPDRVHRLFEQAHRECFIANTLSAEISLGPRVDVAAP